jgi:hypothetical protein
VRSVRRGPGRLEEQGEGVGTRVLLAALWLFHWLPLGVQAFFGNRLGELAFRFVRSRRKVALRNLELCFPSSAPPSGRRWRASTSAGSAAACSSAACSGTRRLGACSG